MKPILDNLESKHETGQSNQLNDIGWKMKLQISSEAQQKEKIPLAHVQFHINDRSENSRQNHDDLIDFEMNHSEVLEMYNQMEAIQNELDALRNGK